MSFTPKTGLAMVQARLRHLIEPAAIDDETLLAWVGQAQRRLCERARLLPKLAAVYDVKDSPLTPLPADYYSLEAIYRNGVPVEQLPIDASRSADAASGFWIEGNQLGIRPTPTTGLTDASPLYADSFARISPASDTFGTSADGSIIWQRKGAAAAVIYSADGTRGLAGPLLADATTRYQLVQGSDVADSYQRATLSWNIVPPAIGGADRRHGLTARYTANDTAYKALLVVGLDQRLRLVVHRVVGGVLDELDDVELATGYTPGEEWVVEFQVEGSALRATAYRVLDGRPAGWLIEGDDGTEPIATGQLGLNFRMPVGATETPTVTVRDYSATTVGSIATADSPYSLILYYASPPLPATWADDLVVGEELSHAIVHRVRERILDTTGAEQRQAWVDWEAQQFLIALQRARGNAVQIDSATPQTQAWPVQGDRLGR